jgi:hypothetical protein
MDSKPGVICAMFYYTVIEALLTLGNTATDPFLFGIIACKETGAQQTSASLFYG